MKIKETITPKTRQLWGYAFDPSLSLSLNTDKINRMVYKINWEDLKIGPVGEYVEIIDYDPTVEKYYLPIDLEEKYILAQNGMEPSIGNPQFHQQMVYAVTMNTIQNFEKALGRKVMWSPRRVDNGNYEEYVQHLRIYPHALRAANAYYSPLRKSILFGYFNSRPSDKTFHMPNSLVFTCLSHDIITHEVTHAILDGIYGEYGIPTNPDMLAFHEAFADIVALFQHFTYPDVVKFEISNTQGRLGSENLLGKLAVELGSAIGGYGSLRDAIGKIDKKTKEWIPKEPNPEEINKTYEPHARGSILVATIFDAFLTIYRSRIKDLITIANQGNRDHQDGPMHPALINRLAKEASKSAKHVLHMCIRALDYCPPIDLNFGDFLRAIISADIDLLKEDSRDYRLAFIEAFRRRGIYPNNVKTLSIESLKYPNLKITQEYNKESDDKEEILLTSSIESKIDSATKDVFHSLIDLLKEFASELHYTTDRQEIFTRTKDYISDYTDENNKRFKGLHTRLRESFADSEMFSELTGLGFMDELKDLGVKSGSGGFPSFQIESMRKITRVGPDGNQINQVIFSMLQYLGYKIDPDTEEEITFKVDKDKVLDDDSIIFHGGCTFIFDLDNSVLKYVISKPLIKRKNGKILIHPRAKKQYAYQIREMKDHIGESRLYFGSRPHEFAFSEPFAFLHHH
jgi:hypothetical protein